MMRGGILQWPKRRVVCLLCSYRQRPLGYALRAYSEDASRNPQSPLPKQAGQTGPAPGQHNDKSGIYGFSTGITATGPSWGAFAPGGLGTSAITTSSPSWGAASAFTQPTLGSSTLELDDGLFPHERLARERAMGRKAKGPDDSNDSLVKKGAIPEVLRPLDNSKTSAASSPSVCGTAGRGKKSSSESRPRSQKFGSHNGETEDGKLSLSERTKKRTQSAGLGERSNTRGLAPSNTERTSPLGSLANALATPPAPWGLWSSRDVEELGVTKDSSWDLKRRNPAPRGSEPLRGFERRSQPRDLDGLKQGQTSPASRDEFWARARDRAPASSKLDDPFEFQRGHTNSRRRSQATQTSGASPLSGGILGLNELEKLASNSNAKTTRVKRDSDSWDWADGYNGSKGPNARRVIPSNTLPGRQESAPGFGGGWQAFERASSRPNIGRGLADIDSGTWNGADSRPAARQIRDSETETSTRGPPPREAADSQDAWSRKKERDRRQRLERDTSVKRSQRKQIRARAQDDDFDTESFEERRRRRQERKEAKERARREAEPIPILLPELISVSNLGTALGIKSDIFLSQLEEFGFEDITKDSILTGETAALIAQEYGFEPSVEIGEDEDLKPRPPAEDPSTLPIRPPVVTIMGHVDHGKTTLLDFLRKSSIVSQEHGGITQHIGAFSVEMSTGKRITFLDTPGHAAFLSMRQRGANVTDIVILVVAADDSVKPQTLEALKHARAAKVPIIVAINKVDKESANIERVKSDLAASGVEIEDFGGDVQVVCVSGKTGQGMADLEENILLLAEMLDIRAETDGMAEGWVLESSIKPIGRVATVLVKRGTLHPGDFIVAGTAFAKIRSLRNEAGQDLDEAPPGTAVEILGWKDEPLAGDQVLQAPDEDKAKTAIHYREELKERHKSVLQQTQMDQERREKAAAEVAAQEKEDENRAEDSAPGTKIVNFTIKGDVHGSVEAVCAAVLELGNNEVRPRVLQSAPGLITEWDVEHAAISGSTILNFNNPVPGHIKGLADAEGVNILEHNVIYHLTEEVRDILSGYLAPVIKTKVLAEAEILKVFPINLKGRKYKNVAGCRVRNGQVTRNARIRIMRNGESVFEGNIESLKHGKREAAEIKKGSECGIMVGSDWDDFREGDFIQTLEEIRETRRL